MNDILMYWAALETLAFMLPVLLSQVLMHQDNTQLISYLLFTPRKATLLLELNYSSAEKKIFCELFAYLCSVFFRSNIWTIDLDACIHPVNWCLILIGVYFNRNILDYHFGGDMSSLKYHNGETYIFINVTLSTRFTVTKGNLIKNLTFLNEEVIRENVFSIKHLH